MQVNFFDIIILIPLLLSVVFGMKSGSVKLMIGFIFFIISLWLTYLIFPSFGEVLARHMENEFLINFFAIAVSYIMSSLFCTIIAKSLKKMAGDSSGGFMDKFLGTLLGALRGLLVSLIIFILISVVTGKTYLEAENLHDVMPKEENEQPDWVKNSMSYETMLKLTHFIASKIGEDYLKDRKVPDFIE